MKHTFLIPAVLITLLAFATGCSNSTTSNRNTTDTLWIDNGNRHIFGLWHKPADANGLAIFVHGFNGTHRDANKYRKVLAERGYQCYAFDFPCGSRHSLSDNNVSNMSVKDELSDLLAIIRHFRQEASIDTTNIILIGESQGGLASVLASAETPDAISRMVLIFPALCIPGTWADRYPEGTAIPDTTRLWGVNLNRHYFEDVRELKPFDAIPHYTKPVLIIQGDKDPIVSMEDSQRARRMYKDAKLRIISGAAHGFSPSQFPLVEDKIRHFLPAAH